MIEGNRVILRPMVLKERPKFYRWATQSEATQWWYGDLYGDDVPGYEVFKLEWTEDYFTDEFPERGRCFVIVYEGKEVGQINYNEILPADKSTELDILIPSNQFTGQGIGTDAINTLSRWLFANQNVTRIRVEVVRQNIRAQKAYAKAGYQWIYTYILNGIEWHVMERLPLDP